MVETMLLLPLSLLLVMIPFEIPKSSIAVDVVAQGVCGIRFADVGIEVVPWRVLDVVGSQVVVCDRTLVVVVVVLVVSLGFVVDMMIEEILVAAFVDPLSRCGCLFGSGFMATSTVMVILF